MSTFFPGGIFQVSGLVSPAMQLRDRRLKEAKTHSDKIQRELARDRMSLERKEKQLMAECKRLAQKGDMHGARLISNQIARYRRIHDRNLESSVLIGTKSQAMVSDHKVNKAEVETIKGFTYANTYESFERAEAREQRYAFRMGAINHLEGSMRETMDELYRGGPEDVGGSDNVEISDEPNAVHIQELEIQSILRQAMGGEKKRTYFVPAAGEEGNVGNPLAPFTVEIKRMDDSDLACAITLNPITAQPVPGRPVFSVSTFTIDQMKRRIIEDVFAAGQLNLTYTVGNTVAIRPFQIGTLDRNTMEFEPFGISETLADTGVENGDILYVKLLGDTTGRGSSSGGSGSSGTASRSSDVDPDALLRNRMNRLNVRDQ